MTSGFEYVASKGIESATGYPYNAGTTEKAGTCDYKFPFVQGGFGLKSNIVTMDSCDDLLQAV